MDKCEAGNSGNDLLAPQEAADRAHFIRDRYPAGGLFAGLNWRISPQAFALGRPLAAELEAMGRVLLQFNRAVNLLYRQSVAGKRPAWIASWLDLGKPDRLIQWQRSPAFKNDLPRIIRPDVLLTDAGLTMVELDGVPGGIGATAWLNQPYSALSTSDLPGQAVDGPATAAPEFPPRASAAGVLGGAEGMLTGFAGVFGDAPQVHIVISEEAATYRPEMSWLCEQLGASRFQVRDTNYIDFHPGEAVYRFYELFDLPNVANANLTFQLASEKKIRLTPPAKPIFEEKMLFALLWNRHLHDFWRQELGEGFFDRLRQWTPYTWLMDASPLPPHGAIPELNLTDWRQLKTLSQRERELILKISGFSDLAWGSRGVYLGSDLSQADWSQAVDQALAGFAHSPYVLQRFHRPKQVAAGWYDFETHRLTSMTGRVRLCPYYFIAGEGDGARAKLGGVLATICPSDKKLIHGMSEAILAPCSA